jgi:hypothetical protein
MMQDKHLEMLGRMVRNICNGEKADILTAKEIGVMVFVYITELQKQAVSDFYDKHEEL